MILDDTIIYNYTYTLMLIVCLSSLIMIFITLFNITLDKHQKTGFSIIFLITGIIAGLDFSMYLIESNRIVSLIPLDYILNFFFFVLTPLLPLLIARIVYVSKATKYAFYVYGVYALIFAILVATNQIYIISDSLETFYSRQVMFYPTHVAFTILSFIFLLSCMIIVNRKMLSTHPIMFLILFFLLGLGMSVQMLLPHIHINFLIVEAIVILFYIYNGLLKAQIDGLTGLFSQHCYLYMIERIKEDEVLFLMDCNEFKKINDEYGHIKGDEILKEIAKIVQQVFGKQGKCYRIGGDEFAAICKKGCSPDQLVAKFNQKLLEHKESIISDVAVGYQRYSPNQDIASFKDEVDKIMYQNKHKKA